MSDTQNDSADDTEMAAHAGPTASSAAAIGRRRQPSTARKITACIACRRLKIKCHMPDSGAPPCVRCTKRGSACVVSSSPQLGAADDDPVWKSSVMQRLGAFEDFMQQTTCQLSTIQAQLQQGQANGLQQNQAHGSVPDRQLSKTPLSVSSSMRNRQMEVIQEGGEIRMEVDRGPAIIPSSSTINVEWAKSGTSRKSRSTSQDLVHLGLLTLDQAQTLFDIYAHRLDHYLYCILGKFVTLQTVRNSSSLLLAAVCTVGSLHCPELASVFDTCYGHFRSLTADTALDKSAKLDDIRGLCIGAFWLRDIAWNLSSIAVTLATQQHMHQCSVKNASRMGPVLHERIRLYYIVYICDHHFSIAYGRPPMTSESDLTRQSQSFLDAPNSTEDDARVVSQLQVWSAPTKCLDLMGFDVDEPVPEALIPSMRRLLITLDTWRANWNDEFGHNPHVGNYPRKGVKLHYHFARLYLCSHAYRGLDSAVDRVDPNDVTQTSPSAYSQSHEYPPSRRVSSVVQPTPAPDARRPIHPDLDEFADAAVDSAQTILRTIVTDSEILSHLNGLPLYFDTMIAFAIVFLFKVANKYPEYARVGSVAAMELIHDVSESLRVVTADMHRRHFLVALSAAVDKLLSTRMNNPLMTSYPIPIGPRDWHSASDGSFSRTDMPQDAGYHTQGLGLNWSPGGFDWTNYDFLATGNDFMTYHTG